jgi:hypothetical protein
MVAGLQAIFFHLSRRHCVKRQIFGETVSKFPLCSAQITGQMQRI